ncbi:hypothetical protein Dda_3527 [Drechslerella dactyloides]|uniref:Uncharacterized protein n=1 Tax=Drechslerella dactyloides TaxID=74499 RepID=A0AAD6J2F5_DREDA|nr:hypothetical protein Dda_3527 [Drechslerella dactyloides]
MSGVGSEMDSSDPSAPHDGVKAALSERHAREIGQLQIQAPRLLSPIQPDSPLTTPLGSPDVLQENQTWPRMASGTSEQMEEDAPEAALKMRKENVAPAANQQLRADQDSTGLVDAKGDFDIYEDSSAEIESADLRPPTPDISAPQSTERQILSDVIEPDVLADADFDEELLHQLQSMYSSASESDISMRLLHAIEDGFEAKYTAAFDVFYNTRRFFGQPCGIILDAAFSQEHVISSGTATGKSIYGVHGVHGCDAHADDHDADTECEQHCSAPPNTPNASRRVPAAAGDVLNVSKSRQASESSSIVQQRISSFETPRYIPVEKKYQTSPSYQLLNAIKPVRGRSLKGRFVPSSDGVDAQTEVETVNPVSGTLQDENSASCSESVEPQDHNPFEISTSKSASSHVGELEISDNQDTSEAVSPEQEDSVIINQSEKSERESCGASSILHHIYDSEVDPSPLPSPDFSDPQIITSTPDRNSALNSPIAPLDDIPINENRQSDSIEAHSLDAASISNTLPKSPTRIMQEIDGNRQLLPPKPRVTSDEKSKVSETVNEFDADDNKENIAPEEELLVAPLERTNVYLGERQMSLSSLSRGAQSEANDEVPALVSKGVKSGKNSRWQKRPLRMVKSAIDSLRVKDVRGSASQEKGRKKRRPSVLNLFKFSRAYEAVNEPDLTGTPSFRVLPTIDSPSIMEPEVSPRSPRRAKSSLGVRLDRKKKPILAVPKYPRRRRSRGNIFGLFEFGRMQQRSSFIVHSDSKPSTPQRNSFASSKFFASRISRRFALNILPLFRRKTFSVPPAPEPQEEDELIQIQRTPSPPPRLELQLPRSGL